MYEILINILIFSGILLSLALVFILIQGILILFDVRKMIHQIKEKLMVITSIFDVVSLLGQFGGRMKKKGVNSSSSLIAAIAGIKRGLKVFFDKEEKCDG